MFNQGHSFSQGLTGKWYWENEQLQADVYFADDKYFMEAFVKGTSSQVSEGFSFFFINGDTLIFNKVPLHQGREPIAYHLIKSINDFEMDLIDMRNGNKNRYKRINRDYTYLSRYQNNEFYFEGGGRFCISDQPDPAVNPCLNFGNISINSSMEDMKAILGKPDDVINQEASEFHVFYLQALEDGSQPYFAVELVEGQIKSIQVTGARTRELFSFSSISLGDYYTFVEQRLGKPSDTGSVHDDLVYWDYDPFTFSFEMKNGFVYSMKLRRP